MWHLGSLRAAALFTTLAICACSGGGTTSAPQSATDAATKAVYNDDLNGMQSHFDPALQKQVTIDGVASLSQKLHTFGDYKGLTQTAADASDGRYDYNAAFANTNLAVHVRLDQDGRIAAYRIDVPQNISTTH
jgi:hypothetical protein